ncbi:hypothetical protein [Streptomyces goshikiensis]|uniref:hypothetical protein n=1 Tax=Streptomyces goshikiensis TaxID=1942 RepID=UPI003717B836
MNAETWASVGVSVVTGASGVWAVRAARRTPRQEKRDDFTAVTDRMNGEIVRQGKQIEGLEIRADRAERRVEGAGVAIAYLIGRVRELHGYIRSVGMEPPTAEPIPEAARDFIHHDM